ncbi:MAG: HAD family hydrolase [Egibacteraceae bacterium]
MASFKPGVLLDLDGTLVDTVFHHVLCWHQALDEHGYTVPMWRIHAGIGMGSERLVPWLVGRQVKEVGELSDRHTELFLERADAFRPTHGAAELIEDLKTREIAFLVATSAGSEEREALLAALEMPDLTTADSSNVGSAKPAPDLLLVACEELGVEPSQATMVGDSPWDQVAARTVGIRGVGVRTGGFGDEAMTKAGAELLADDPAGLIGRL